MLSDEESDSYMHQRLLPEKPKLYAIVQVKCNWQCVLKCAVRVTTVQQ